MSTQSRFQSFLSLAIVAGLFGVVVPHSAAQTTVSIRLIDGETGLPTPAMVSLVDVDDGMLRLPPDGRTYDGGGTVVSQFHAGYAFDPDPNWIGPVRKMAGEGNNRDRSFVYESLPSVPYWDEEFAYQTSGDFSVELEPGTYRLSAMRGNEYIPIREELEIDGVDEERVHTFVLQRWINLPKQGWYSGDVHVHHPTTKDAYRDYLLHYATAEDLHVVNVSTKRQYRPGSSGEMGRWEMLTRQAGFGEEYRFQKGNYVLVPAQEHPQSIWGHITGMNIQEMTRPELEHLNLYDLTFNALEEQGAPVGYAHFSWNGLGMPRGFPHLITTGGIDFVEMLQFRHLNTESYYEYLNLGFKLSAAAGSDVPFGSTLGEVRTYVHTGEAFDVDRWFEGLKVGRTFVSNGPVLDLKVDGQMPGSEVHVERNHRAQVSLRALSHPAIGRIEHVQLVGHEGVIREFHPQDEDGVDMNVEIELPIDRSQWIVASTVCDNGAVAHTSPVYVIVNDEPFYSLEKAPGSFGGYDLDSRRMGRQDAEKSHDKAGARCDGLLSIVERGDLLETIARTSDDG